MYTNQHVKGEEEMSIGILSIGVAVLFNIIALFCLIHELTQDTPPQQQPQQISYKSYMPYEL